ncbi:NADPH-dependent 7-cyano-7-deazaguanine reductase QueF [Thiomicrorhabdus sp. ZW0627]|uniref:NADPH-dependent 7-cyano-7-deazaguanine reductase QueF n=1 Tax=Thiomicrorhabdus sp. ZW0627 TaxID=3039774 RepID=UPI002436F00B|nr:NADPH-dependent 7-cyano-7-deazaguanine reductase QueF [Thiomicrorhabdus sp. ZW0627]MDG6774268.1 NADPH-dependent 7-cyano-7-deazaguanine reductase QueF [Thiomicrorhabdus sp. ZW0627]
MKPTSTANQSLLGKATPYCKSYDPSLLFPIPRQEKRDELGFDLDSLPFQGLDIWSAFEVSWLNAKGKPIAVIAEFAFPADSPNLIESKSFKLYLNSFNGTRFDSRQQVINHWVEDLSAACGAEVAVDVRDLDMEETLIGRLPGKNLDGLDIEVDDYQVNPELLTLNDETDEVEETLNSHLLKSNCLVTGQPDWGSIVIRYRGRQINHENLLKYLISFREHNEFHEQCVERVFTDIMQRCRPSALTVYARYVRRGGLDINPYRSNFEDEFDISRTLRQ